MDALARTIMTLNCADCDVVPKVHGAGSIAMDNGERVQLMHNGLKVVAGGYHGEWMASLIRGLRGHHEPQEERIFHHLLRFVRHDTLMVELASFWAYYSLWYLREISGSDALCVEPDPHHMAVGRRNAQLNRATERIRFVEAWIGDESRRSHCQVCETTGQPRSLPCFDVEGVLAHSDYRPIELLHIDAQGAELGFIRSMSKVPWKGKLRFMVVSTHHSSISYSATTHQDCLDAICELGGFVLAAYDVQESFSGDGLIAASFMPQDRAIDMPQISRNNAARSLFAGPCTS